MKPRRVFTSKAGWREIGGSNIYFRSEWEVQIARYLEECYQKQLILGWEYEPKIFTFDGIKRGITSYKPDFRVTRIDSSIYWLEVKGYMDAFSRTKLKRFKRYFPNEEFHLIDKDWFKKQKSTGPILEDLWIFKKETENETGET
jgi:hypothetical protein